MCSSWIFHGRNSIFLEFNDGHRRKGFGEYGEQREKESETADRDSHFHDGGPVFTPGGRDVFTLQRTADDVETLEPHAHVDQHTDNPDSERIVPYLPAPEGNWGDHVAKHHQPEGNQGEADLLIAGERPTRHFAKGTEVENCPLKGAATVPANEELRSVSVTHNNRSKEDHPTYALNYMLGDIILEAENGPDRYQHGQHH